jgi:pimeloyl-ACP methyl ester carboxylesterase
MENLPDQAHARLSLSPPSLNGSTHRIDRNPILIFPTEKLKALAMRHSPKTTALRFALDALPPAGQARAARWADVATQSITAGGVDFAYRELGKHHGGTPVVLLVHLAAVLDNWDPRIVDGLAARHHVIAFDNRGIGASSGSPSSSMEQMADDAITFIKAKGLKQVDLFGFSMGGMIAQEIVLKDPADLSLVKHPVLVANGDADRMVPTKNTHDLARRLPNSTLIVYPDSGHGAIFQFHADFVPKALEFLAR